MEDGMRWRTVVADLERCLTARGRTLLGRFRIEGTRLHQRALRAGVAIEQAVAGESFRRSANPRARRLLEDLETAGCQLHTVPDEVVTGLT